MQQPSHPGSDAGPAPINNIQVMRTPAPQKSVATVSPRVIVGSPIQRPGPSTIPSHMLQNMGSIQRPLLVKNDIGQYQFLRVGPNSLALNAQSGRGRAPPPGVSSSQSASAVIVPMTELPPQSQHLLQQQLTHPPHEMFQGPPQQFQQLGSVPILQTSQPGFSQVVQHVIKPDNSKEKCRNFLANLLELSSKEPPSVERNVKTLIQELIDGAVEAMEFCSRLERLLNANSQPCLVGFLMKSLPQLRQSLAQQELVIPGIRAPPLRVAFPPAPQPPVALAPATVHSITVPYNLPVPVVTVPIQVKEKKLPSPAPMPAQFTDDKMAGDDDINDVAAMGGVNLLEESQRIATSHNIGAQIRSCPEEHSSDQLGMRMRMRAACLERGLAEPAPEAVLLMTHALRERVRTLVERLVATAMHRQDLECKTEGYEVSQDVKGQLKFLEELDRVEKRRREESEREVLLRAAKSRSKTEDPEQAKLKAKAKEMQRAEMEEVRQREANLTALQAIGPRKRARPEAPAAPQQQPNPTRALGRARLKRVALKDMLHLLENDRVYAHSSILYKAYLKG